MNLENNDGEENVVQDHDQEGNQKLEQDENECGS
jgi:hypothetical protein